MNPDEPRRGRGGDRHLAVFAVGRRGTRIAMQIQRHLGADVFVPRRFAGDHPPFPSPGAAELREQAGAPREHSSVMHLREGGLKAELARAFGIYRGLALVLPVGAAVRLVAPLLEDKHTDPAVVAIDEAGRYAVALVSGHEGGANALARQIAGAIGAQPIITTAAEAVGTLALDLLGRAWGWTIEDATHLTAASAAMIDAAPVGVYQDAGEEDWWHDAPANLTRYASLTDLLAATVAARVAITDRVVDIQREPATVPAVAPRLVYRPKTLVVGVGCVRGASADEIEQLIDATLDRRGLARQSVRGLATIDRKRDEEGILQVARRNGWDLQFLAAHELARIEPASGASAVVERTVGTPAVCEPAAMLAAGPGAQLVAPKARTDRVTVAVARIGATPARGRLSVVGLGPGAREEMTEHARAALEAADAVVGYSGYLDQVRPWLPGKRYHGSPIGEEVERCRLAIGLARQGLRVAMVSSGDAGIYGTAGIVLELLAAEGAQNEADRVEIVPGVSAATMAASLLGAPLMSDFATVSLSDLMTPWKVIERRLEAVAASDMVLALYNPASARRRAPLERAVAILLAHRAPDTPVGLVRNASRPGQRVALTDLQHILDHPVDMLTILIVGNSATVRVSNRLVTRRGYPVGWGQRLSQVNADQP